jgi:hypothetical protein
MCDNKRKDAEALRAWVETLTVGEYKSVINRVIEECKVRKSTYHNWRTGACRIPPLAKEKIEAIAGEKVFDE